MKGAMNKILGAAAMAAFVAACSSSDDKDVAGGASGDMGIVASAITGDAQKGPFVKGSAVTVQGIDCKTLQLTDERFEGEVNSDKGDFSVKDVSFKSTCALFEVTGLYRSEITGKTSSKELTLRALTDLKDRESVNINILTNLEYERLVHLVTEKGKTFAEAKAQAEQEVLAAFDIAGSFEEFENLNIFESGDGNAALLAVSVMMQAKTDDAGLAKRIEKFEDSFAETGVWKDSAAKATISDWAAGAIAGNGLDSIRKNIETWDIGDTVAAFEKYIEAFGDTTYNAEKNTLTDARDGKVYKTVKIGDQVWMAENLNYKTVSSFCYNDSAGYCEKYGRIYTWAAAINACPEGWHLPTIDEFETLFATVGGQSTAGTMLKSTSGWNSDGNGTDDFGFAALPAGIRYSAEYYNYEGHHANFWSSTKNGSDSVDYVNLFYGYDDAYVRTHDKNDGMSVRCLKGSVAAPESSSSVPEGHVDPSTVEKGTMTDDRDGKIYRTVKIGEQVWMAENLNFETDSSYCYNDSAEYCAKYGRLYEWSAAMDACPSGWHLPDTAEWRMLLAAVGGDSIAGMKLKSTSGWNSDGNGTDDFGFTVLPAGGWDNKMFEGEAAGFWSSVGYGNYATAIRLLADAFAVRLISGRTYVGHSVRCVKGSATAPKSSSSSAEVQPNSSETESSSSSGDDKMNCSALLEGETDWNWNVPKECRFNPDIDYGTMIDTRDNKQYKTVKIGDQVWMAENLNFDPGQGGSGDTKYDWSWCHNNKAEHCDVAGRFYTWAAAIDSAKLATDADKTMDCGYGKECGLDSAGSATLIQGICPDGWHLPNNGEWNSLFTAVGGAGKAGTFLKSQTGWYGNGNGTDAFGFTALSVGRSYSYASFDFDGLYAYFWSATENDSSYAYGMYLYYRGDDVGAGLFDSYKNYGFSVRCVKD